MPRDKAHWATQNLCLHKSFIPEKILKIYRIREFCNILSISSGIVRPVCPLVATFKLVTELGGQLANCHCTVCTSSCIQYTVHFPQYAFSRGRFNLFHHQSVAPSSLKQRNLPQTVFSKHCWSKKQHSMSNNGRFSQKNCNFFSNRISRRHLASSGKPFPVKRHINVWRITLKQLEPIIAHNGTPTSVSNHAWFETDVGLVHAFIKHIWTTNHNREKCHASNFRDS